MKGTCEQCGKYVEKYLAIHHVIPRWLGGENGETMKVCPPCHRRLDSMFERFIKYGGFKKPKEWYNKERYKNYYRRNKVNRISYQVKYYKKHRRKLNRYNKQWRKNNPDKHYNNPISYYKITYGKHWLSAYRHSLEHGATTIPPPTNITLEDWF